MEKALPWIIVILSLFVIWACVEVGWLYSILTIGVVGGVIYVIHVLDKKASQIDSSEHDKQLANVFRKIVIGISALLICVGVILGCVCIATPETDGYRLQQCGYCGGSGRLSSGEKCGLCKGAGGAVYENYLYSNHLWTGILMAASGAVMLLCAMSYSTPSSQPDCSVNANTTNINASAVSVASNVSNQKHISAIRFESLNTKSADFTMMLGHWTKQGSTPQTWISNEPDTTGAWTMRCRISNKSGKTINDLSLTVTLYDNEGKTVLEHKVYHAARIIKTGEIHSLWWEPLCPNITLAKGVLECVEIQFTDGTMQNFTRY